MKKIGDCPDCERKNVEIVTSGMYEGLCKNCRRRKVNAKSRKINYIPYKNLSDEDKMKIDNKRKCAQKKKNKIEIPDILKIVPVNENYYQIKAENDSIEVYNHIEKNSMIHEPIDQTNFINILKDCDYEISEEEFKSALNTLLNIEQLKNIFINIIKNDDQKIILNLEQILDSTEKKLQYTWEVNGFQKSDDIKFKNFLIERRTLKETIFFWKKLCQSNVIKELQKIWEESKQNDIINREEITKND